MLKQFLNFKLKILQNKKKTIKIFLIFLLFSLFPFNLLYSYNDTDTHPDLTVEIVKLYNLQSPENKFSNEEMELVRQGSILEDTPPRWINHFYNPETKKGWTADNLRGVSQKKVQRFSDWFLSSEKPVSSLNWARNQELQNKYSLYQGNHTFQKAVYDYAVGKKEEGLKSLGYILHLIEDASVPEHTRDDTHADISSLEKGDIDRGSPYENWAEDYTINHSLTIAKDLNSEDRQYYKCEGLDSCLMNLVNYSHYNFFSEDTIKEYSKPEIVSFKKDFLENKNVEIGYSLNNNPIVIKLNDGIYTLGKNNPILSSYWSLLSSESVLTGAGVIETFFKEVNKAKNDSQYLDSLKFEEKQMTIAQSSFMPLVFLFEDKVISPTGEYFRIKSVYNDLKSLSYEVKQKIIEEANRIKNLVEIAAYKTKQIITSEVNKLKNLAENMVSDIRLFFQNNILTQQAGLLLQQNQQTVSASFPLTSDTGGSESAAANSAESDLSVLGVPKISLPQPKVLGQSANSDTGSALNSTDSKNNLALRELSFNNRTAGYTPGFGGGGAVSASDGNGNFSSFANASEDAQTNSNPSAVGQNSASSTNSGTASSTQSSTSGNGSSSGTVPQGKDTTSPLPPVLLFPSDLNQTFTSRTLEFQGTAEANSVLKAEYFFGSATTTLLRQGYEGQAATSSVSSAGAWSLSLNLNEGTTTLLRQGYEGHAIIFFYAKDASGNTSSSTRAEIFIDSLAPQIADFKILECGLSSVALAKEDCLIATTTINLVWSATLLRQGYEGQAASDLNYFELSWSGGEQGKIATTSSSTSLTLKDGGSYIFSLRARDKSGNWSEPSELSLEINSKPVVINEVAWSGTGRETSGDEWIELLNRTGQTINLSNFVFRSETNKPYVNLKNSIAPYGYYLMERKDDNTTDVPADLIYGNYGPNFSLNNSYENLYLQYVEKGATTTIDKVLPCNPFSWCGGLNNSYATMERYNSDENYWGTNLEVIRNGKNRNGVLINGTPKTRNSLNYLLATTTYLQQDTTLTKQNSPYFIFSGITVSKGITLKIEPGVVIKAKDFSNSALDVYGALYAAGNENDKIVFTSLRDDNYEGDLNGDGSLTSPRAGDWSGVYLRENSSSTVSYVKFKYGGGYGFPCCFGMLRVYHATSTITNSEFESSFSYGLELIISNSYVVNNIFRNNNNYPTLSTPAGINVGGDSSKILNNVLENNYIGIMESGGGEAEVADNVFNNNISKAVFVLGTDGIGSFKNNSGVLSASALDGIYVSNLSLKVNATTTLYSNSLPYVFYNNLSIPVHSALVVKPGVLIKNSSDNRIEVYGSLITEGASPYDIIFTSLYEPPVVSYWFGISANPGSRVLLTGATVKYGGMTTNRQKEAGLFSDRADLTIENSLFENNYKHGAIIVNSDSQIKNTEFKGHTKPDFDSRGLAYYGSTINLNNVAFRNNYFGLYVDPLSLLGTIVEPIIFEGNASTSNIWLGL